MAMISCDEVGVNGLGILPTSLGDCHGCEWLSVDRLKIDPIIFSGTT